MIPEHLKARLLELPQKPGVYLFKDRAGKVLYIGKALSLKKRVASHFRFYGRDLSKEGVMLSHLWAVDILETPTEAEALLLEAALVKEQLPKYNKLLRDDKSYPFLKITAEEYPRLLIVRQRKADGGKYFGPYTGVGLLRQAVDWLRHEFPLRTCRKLPKKVCLMYHLGLCGGHVKDAQGMAEYLARVKELEFFLQGRRDVLVRQLTKRMKEYSVNREYEEANRVLSEIKALSAVSNKGEKTDLDKVLKDLQEALALPKFPKRIECYDISNISGKEAVGSMVVFIDGSAARSEYRKFRIKTVHEINDYKMMQEVIRRRFSRAILEKQMLPELVVIDGGKGHLSSVKIVMEELGLADVAVISIAKQHEYLFKPDRETPFIFPQSSPFLEMIRRLRDEAHRFAISYHRKLHRKAVLNSTKRKAKK